jgi:hypothetical protein
MDDMTLPNKAKEEELAEEGEGDWWSLCSAQKKKSKVDNSIATSVIKDRCD